MTALLESFMCALPADELMESSQNVMDGVYESTWYDRSLTLQKNVLCMLIPQRPVVIDFKLLKLVLSLNYYCSYISNTFSMFAALRVIVGEEDEI
ncbi:uncharacterized protein LOC143181487 [Calliopsis andreniformis]|uniref:uncharacterized protein LOC143181487 n=1 Tax=Calliopsis andreniformis TaxID=337506 RepID=UPI003FCEE499